jgi:hypothetical protein
VAPTGGARFDRLDYHLSYYSELIAQGLAYVLPPKAL